MNDYINQLLELIDESIKKAYNKNNYPNGNEVDYSENNHEFADEFLNGTPEKIASIVGIAKYHFPTSDKLNNEQTDRIYSALEELLTAYNLEFMFPEAVNSKIKYRFIVDQWNSKHIHCKQAVVQIETCKFDENNCPFPGHCKVCESFKSEYDTSHPLSKGLVDFNNLMPDFSVEEEGHFRQNVDKFKTLMKSSHNENYISGIHNYCDGRCKKCHFTNQCSSYALNIELDKQAKKSGQDEEMNYNHLSVILQASTEIIEEELRRHNIEIEDISNDDTAIENQQTVKHSLEKQAESYAQKVKRWLESNQIELESRLVNQPNMQMHLETITWFQLFIPTKTGRAIKGLQKSNLNDIESFDAKGSAKITLIAIDECLAAWEQILQYIPKKEDSILNILTHLSKLKQKFETLFPKVRDFIRPGLDE